MMNINNNKIFINDDWYYTISRIKKRIIFAPCNKLKKAQKFFLNSLKWRHPLSLDSLKAAQFHINKKWVLKMDIKDFYNSVPFNHIEAIIKPICEQIENVNINEYLELTTVDGKLPTGLQLPDILQMLVFK